MLSEQIKQSSVLAKYTVMRCYQKNSLLDIAQSWKSPIILGGKNKTPDLEFIWRFMTLDHLTASLRKSSDNGDEYVQLIL